MQAAGLGDAGSNEPASTGSTQLQAYPSLDIVLDLVREQARFQREQIQSLDTKAGFVLGSSSILTTATFAFRLPAVFVPPSWLQLTSADIQEVAVVLPRLAIVVYGLVVFTSFIAYLPFPYFQAPASEILLDEYLTEKAENTKSTVAATILDAIKKNRSAIRRKTTWTLLALIAFVAQVLIIMTLLFLTNHSIR